ncbi:hypothetical protein [Arenimonas sp. SCN 70-307]|uniref:hypothetical protein n=1 Tax=Arenimonas sp. SCN 70-307 TaxID=1660089 RepID=UPI0025BDF981|nr:hypothetical protein [Arenimonas sp. SCN 70-307]
MRRWQPDAQPAAVHASLLAEAKRIASAFPGTEQASKAARVIPAIQAKVDAFAEIQAQEASARKWTYASSKDELTGKQGYTAWLQSENQIELKFPYQGPQRAQLTIRESPQYGFDVMFSIQRGQLLCSSYDGCSVQVRIDEAPPRRWRAMPPSDHSNETLFLGNERELYRSIRGAKEVRIQAEIYQAGAPTFIFDVSGFEESKFKPKS